MQEKTNQHNVFKQQYSYLQTLSVIQKQQGKSSGELHRYSAWQSAL